MWETEKLLAKPRPRAGTRPRTLTARLDNDRIKYNELKRSLAGHENIVHKVVLSDAEGVSPEARDAVKGLQQAYWKLIDFVSQQVPSLSASLPPYPPVLNFYKESASGRILVLTVIFPC